MPRNPAALPLPGRIRRSEEEIRQLRLRDAGSSDVAEWQVLEPYITPGWAAPVNTSISDLTDDFCPRYYVDRQRVYLGGTVQLDRSLLGPYNDYVILDTIPVGLRPTRQVDLGWAFEDQYWTNSSWLGRTAIVETSPGALVLVTGGVDDPIDDGVAISLEPFSWRIDG